MSIKSFKTLTTSTLIAGAALIGAQAWAQQTAAPAQPGTTDVPASQPSTALSDPVSQPAPAGEAQGALEPASPAQPAAPDQSADAAAATPASGNPQVVAFVDQQFPSADADGDGKLSAAEFEGWISKIKAAELAQTGKPVVEAEVKTYASNAFANADKDADKAVTKTELTQFLSQA